MPIIQVVLEAALQECRKSPIEINKHYVKKFRVGLERFLASKTITVILTKLILKLRL